MPRATQRGCWDCHKPAARSGMCADCKRLNRQLRALHRYYHRVSECPADKIGRAERVAAYAAQIAAGMPLFEH